MPAVLLRLTEVEETLIPREDFKSLEISMSNLSGPTSPRPDQNHLHHTRSSHLCHLRNASRHHDIIFVAGDEGLSRGE